MLSCIFSSRLFLVLCFRVVVSLIQLQLIVAFLVFKCGVLVEKVVFLPQLSVKSFGFWN
jgi:hypothetical protein